MDFLKYNGVKNYLEYSNISIEDFSVERYLAENRGLSWIYLELMLSCNNNLKKREFKEYESLTGDMAPLDEFISFCDEAYLEGNTIALWYKIDCCLCQSYYVNNGRISFKLMNLLNAISWSKLIYTDNKWLAGYHLIHVFVLQHINKKKVLSADEIVRIRDAFKEGYSLGIKECAFYIYDLDVNTKEDYDTGFWLEKALEYELKERTTIIGLAVQPYYFDYSLHYKMRSDEKIFYDLLLDISDRLLIGNNIFRNISSSYYWILIARSMLEFNLKEEIENINEKIDALESKLLEEGIGKYTITEPAKADIDNYCLAKSNNICEEFVLNDKLRMTNFSENSITIIQDNFTDLNIHDINRVTILIKIKGEPLNFELADSDCFEIQNNDIDKKYVLSVSFNQFKKMINAKERQFLIKLAYINTEYSGIDKAKNLQKACDALSIDKGEGAITSRLNEMFRQIFGNKLEAKNTLIDKSKGLLKLNIVLTNPQNILQPKL